MKIYLNRSLGYLFLSMCIALTFGPYDGNPFSHPYHYTSLDSPGSEINKELTGGMQTLADQERALRQQTRKMLATHNKLEQEMAQGGNNTEFAVKGQLKRRMRSVRYILAAILLVPGLILMYRVYGMQPGIHVNPRWAAITGDVVFIVFASVMAYCVVAYGLDKITGIKPYLYDPVAMGMVTAAYIPVIVFCAWFASNFSTQSVEIGDEGISVYYPADVLFASWEKIQGFDLKETYTVAGGSEFKAPRKLQTKLVIHAGHEDMECFEPGLKKTKSAIINKLTNNAPQRLHGEIEKLTRW